MGKGYNNYMCKKPFHPGSKANIKRAWMAEQKTENDVRKQEELKLQYEKEQDLYNNRTLLNKESKDKLCLNFMYEAPPGVKKEHEKEEDEPEFKFEWQRKYNAPREDYARGNAEIRDQPFGIQVRNVRCIKCHKWGHINTDKECPMYNKGAGSGDGSAGMDPMELMRRMKEEEGLALKQSILGHHVNPNVANQQLLESEEEDDDDAEMQFLKSLSVKQKEKLLRRLERLDKKAKNGKTTHKKKKSKKTKKSKKRDSSDSDSDHKTKKKSKKSKTKKKKKRKSSKKESSSSSSSSESTEENSSDNDEEKPRKSRKDTSQEASGNGKRQRHDSSDSSDDAGKVSITNRRRKDLQDRNSRTRHRRGERSRSTDRNRNKKRRSSSSD